MPQPIVQSVADVDPASPRPRSVLIRALRLGCVLAAAMALAACDKCGNFLPLSQDQTAACHSDPPPQ